MPAWWTEMLRSPLPTEGNAIDCRGHRLTMRGGLLRDLGVLDPGQTQTGEVFGFKWEQRDTYSSESVRAATRAWLVERYGDWSVPEAWSAFPEVPTVLDAGCGAALTAGLLFGERLRHLRYVGVDVSTAVDVAAQTAAAQGWSAAFLQADLQRLPFAESSFDFILSEGVLHHTPSTRGSLLALARLLKPGGLFAFYVYARKSPLREFSDDYIRDRLNGLSPQEAWEALMPLTRLGKALSELKVDVEVPEDVPLLGIPKGRIDIQRLIYWHICKMYHRPEYTLDEMNHVNFDWFSPAYAHRQTPEEVRGWCAEAGLVIRTMAVEPAGITTIAIRES